MLSRKTITDKNGSTLESNASLFLRRALSQEQELRTFIQKGYNDATGADRTFEDRLYNQAIVNVVVGGDAATIGQEGSVPGERWRTYNVLYGSNISVSMDGGATWHGTCELAPPRAAKQRVAPALANRPAKLTKIG